MIGSFDHDHQPDLHDLGLNQDLGVIVSITRSSVPRRVALRLFGGFGLAALAACGSKSKTSDASLTSTSSPSASLPTAGASSTTSGATTLVPVTTVNAPTTLSATTLSATTAGTIPQETGGPFPGDGTNGPNALTRSGIVRRDVTTSLGSGTKAAGVPLTITMKLTKGAKGDPMPGAAVYIWHCDQQGRYSMYNQGVTNETYLRGVQAADANGEVTFDTIYPGAYQGRWPHIHFEVFESLTAASSGVKPVSTSQLALTEASANSAYATKGYEASIANMKRTTLQRDNVFSDGADRQTPAFTGDAATGFVAVLTVPVA
jgi:protocatechuate 3,4-dioxygenase beta subunit